MEYIVFDMEWNQPLSYRTTIKKPVYLRGEIIQIGALKLDSDFRITDNFKVNIVPKYYTKLNPKVAAVTKLTDDNLKYGFGFIEAFDIFRRWCGKDFAFIMWGTDDVKMLRDNMELYGMDTRWIPNSYNLQTIFSEQVSHESRQIKLSAALEMVSKRTFDEHDALGDARATTEICAHLDMKKGIAEYKDVLYGAEDGCVEKEVFEDAYIDIDDALDDDYVISFECPVCGEIVWCDEWIKQRNNVLLSICSCEDGESYLTKLKFSRAPFGMIKVVRRVYPLTDERLELYNACIERNNTCTVALGVT